MDKKTLSLWDWLGQIPDPRDGSGKRYPLQSVLALLTAGMLNGKTSLRAISRWGRELSRGQLALLNLRRHAPSQTTLHYLLVRLDPNGLEHALRCWIKDSLLEKKLPDALIRAKNAAIAEDYAVLRTLAAYRSVFSAAVERMADDLKNADLTAQLEAVRTLLRHIPVPSAS